jgi:hypothetical protein
MYALVFQVVSFLLAFPQKPFISSPMHTTCLDHFILLYLICPVTFGDKYRIWNTSLCNFLYSPVTSSLFGPNILLRTMFSNNFSLCTSINLRDQVSHPCKTTGRILVLHILTFTFQDNRREDKRLDRMVASIPRITIFYGTWIFISTLPGSYSETDEPNPQPQTILRSIIILSSVCNKIFQIVFWYQALQLKHIHIVTWNGIVGLLLDGVTK